MRLPLAAYDTGAGASGMKTNKQTNYGYENKQTAPGLRVRKKTPLFPLEAYLELNAAWDRIRTETKKQV